MAITSGFFNSVNGDRKYNAEQISEYFGGLISSGVLANPSTNLQVVAKSGMTVQVLAGKGFIDSHWVKNTGAIELTLDAASSLTDRYDAIVMRLDTSSSARNITIAVKKGTSALSPEKPQMTRNASVKEYCLAYVFVKRTQTQVLQSQITDTRGDTKICGWVTGLIDQVDTSALFKQYEDAYKRQYEGYQTEFDTWFDAVKDKLSTSTLLREYRQRYVTSGANTAQIPIQIAQFLLETDILAVYVNGMRLQDDEFSKTQTQITLKKPIDVAGTKVEIVVYKSVDGKDAQTVVGQVEKLQTDVAGIKAESEATSEALGALRNALRQPRELYSGTHTPEASGAMKYLSIPELSQYDIVIVRATIGTMGEQMLYFYKGTASTGKINQSFSVYKDANTYGTATVQYDNIANQIGLRSEAVKTWTASQITIKKVWGIKA